MNDPRMTGKIILDPSVYQIRPDPRDATIAALRAEVKQASGYLGRLLTHLHPQCEPFSDLMHVCAQIDNAMTEIPTLRAEVEGLRAAQRRIVDLAWNAATESEQVPSTDWADRIIAAALKGPK